MQGKMPMQENGGKVGGSLLKGDIFLRTYGSTFSTNIMELASCSVWGLNDITHKHSASSAYYTFSIVTLGVCTIKFTLNLTPI